MEKTIRVEVGDHKTFGHERPPAAALGKKSRRVQALSSAVEHYLDTVGVSSSILLAPTIAGLSRAAAFRLLEGA